MDHPSLSPDELHLLYILLDSNLPTGGFVSSSGLEAYIKHGFLGIASSTSPYHIDPNESGPETGAKSESGARQTGEARVFTAVKGVKDVIRGVTDFAEAEVGHYGNTTGCFVKDSWASVDRYMSSPIPSRRSVIQTKTNDGIDAKDHDQATNDNAKRDEMEEAISGDEARILRTVIQEITALDKYHESSMLSHVARRASKAQGVAMLTLFTRGLTRPVGFEPSLSPDLDLNLYPTNVQVDDGREVDEVERTERAEQAEQAQQAQKARVKEERSMAIISEYKRLVRKGDVPGHLAVCWGVITATLGLALDRSIHLYLFLHARSLLSTAVRMNVIGPYASSQMLLHPFKSIIEVQTSNLVKDGITTGLFSTNPSHDASRTEVGSTQEGQGGHVEEGQANREELAKEADEDDFWTWTALAEMGPATTWPLGEVLMARHDMQHSRIFNS